MAQPVRILKVDRLNAADTVGVNIGRRDLLAERERRQDRQLGSRIVSIDIRRRIGFRIPQACASWSTSSKSAPRFSISVRMKFDVPFRIPNSVVTRSPEMPSRSTA